jgi:PAS domain S-box-containing protein
MQNSTPSAKQIELSNIRPILSRTDLKGKILSCNSYFTEISGYQESELVGSPHNIIRHPDMPKVIFQLMWERLKANKDILAIVKNKTKHGDYYWVTTLFETKYHPLTKEPEAYLAIRKAAPEKAVKEIEQLYKILLEIEKQDGIKASESYLINFLREKNMDYDAYAQDLVHFKGLLQKFFYSMRAMF